MRMMSLTARDGRLPRALADMRKVSWDQRPCALRHLGPRADGTAVPRYHNSEVAAIAWAVQPNPVAAQLGHVWDETGRCRACAHPVAAWRQRWGDVSAAWWKAAAVTAQTASAASAPAAAPTGTAREHAPASSGPAAALHFGKAVP